MTLLLEMTQQGIAGARERLAACLTGADPQVRMFGALALAAYDRSRAIDRLTRELSGPEAWHIRRASEFLLLLGDSGGIPGFLDTLNSDQEPAREFACRNLRVYSQQALPCDPRANPEQRAANIAAWRAWWTANRRTFRVRTREAALDLDQGSLIQPVGQTIR